MSTNHYRHAAGCSALVGQPQIRPAIRNGSSATVAVKEVISQFGGGRSDRRDLGGLRHFPNN